MSIQQLDDHVFINCPFDPDYRSVFEAIVFAVHDCGFVARCALEVADSGEVRIDKILRIIAECRLGIHDISRTEPDARTGLPRFNMPLELGMFLGARHFGSHPGSKRPGPKQKSTLILDREPYRYQVFCSDIAGQDIQAHGADHQKAIQVVRDWLRNHQDAAAPMLPGGGAIVRRYQEFRSQLPSICRKGQLDPTALIYKDFVGLAAEWIKENSR